MALHDVRLRRSHVDPPADVLDLSIATEERARRFIEQRAPESRIAEFQASNLWVAYLALQELLDRDLVAGRSFCEWGSGMGGVTCLAALLGFDACGIEIEPDLVTEARSLASDFQLPARFYDGSFKPSGAYRGELAMGEVERDLGFEPTRFDVVYVYPWPAEERVILELFDYGASSGSLLVTYHGRGAFRARRKVTQTGVS